MSEWVNEWIKMCEWLYKVCILLIVINIFINFWWLKMRIINKKKNQLNCVW
jgi:hypothetical protein